MSENEKESDFPGGPVVKNVPAKAGDMGSVPAQGRSPQALGQLSPCPATTEAYTPWSPCSTTREGTAMRSLHHNESGPTRHSREKPTR